MRPHLSPKLYFREMSSSHISEKTHRMMISPIMAFTDLNINIRHTRAIGIMKSHEKSMTNSRLYTSIIGLYPILLRILVSLSSFFSNETYASTEPRLDHMIIAKGKKYWSYPA